MIDLKAAELRLVQAILAQHLPNIEVRAFGSRVQGDARAYSDLDLVVVDAHKIERRTLYRLQEAFVESSLPFRVDVIDWQRISPSFQEVINQNYQVVQSSPQKQPD